MVTKTPSLLTKLYQKYLREFFVTMGREPITPKEWMDIKNLAVREINATTTSKTKKPWHQGWNPTVIQGGKGIESLLESGAVKKGVAPKTKLSTLEGKKQKLDTAISKEEWIAKRKADNKAALERFKEKTKKKTVEDFRDEGDWDPGGMASGGRTGYAAGKIVKGGRWFIKNLETALKDLDSGKWKNLDPMQKEAFRWELKGLIGRIKMGEPLPEDMIKTIRHDPKFAEISKTRSTDPDLYEFEDVILNYGKKGDVVDEQVKILEEFTPTGKGHASGGRVPLMYGGDPGFAFEYGGSWADWHDQHRDQMPVEQYIKTKLPKDRLPFRALQSGGLAYMLGEPTYMKYSAGGSVGHAPWHKPTGQKPPSGPEETPPPQVVGTPDPLKAPRGIPSVAPKNMDPAYMQQRMMQQAMMGQGPRPMANEGGRIGFEEGHKVPEEFLEHLKRKNLHKLLEEHRRWKEDYERRKDLAPTQEAAEGGIMRMGFKKGGQMSRRGFMKLIAGLAALPVVGKYFKAAKLAKPAAAVTETIVKSNAAGMPAWFPSLVKRVMDEGTDVTKQFGTVEREIVHATELPSGTKVLVTQDLSTGDTMVDIGLGKHGWDAGRHGQPTRLALRKGEWIEPTKGKKGIKTKDEFMVEEAEFTGGHPENVKFEETVDFKYGDHGSDFSEIEQYAMKSPVTSGSSHGEVQRALRREGWKGKKEKARQLAMDKKYGGLKSTYKKDPHVRGKQADLDDWAEGRAESQAEEFDEFASGGLAGLLGE